MCVWGGLLKSFAGTNLSCRRHLFYVVRWRQLKLFKQPRKGCVLPNLLVVLDDRFGGANVCAGAAVHTGCRFDYARRFGFADCAYRTFAFARTAIYTCFRNFVRHNIPLYK